MFVLFSFGVFVAGRKSQSAMANATTGVMNEVKISNAARPVSPSIPMGMISGRIISRPRTTVIEIAIAVFFGILFDSSVS